MYKFSIIGAGEVGASCATCLAERDFVNEIVIVDVKPGLAEGKALDLRQSAALKRFDTIVKGYTAITQRLQIQMWWLSHQVSHESLAWSEAI